MLPHSDDEDFLVQKRDYLAFLKFLVISGVGIAAILIFLALTVFS